MCDDCENVSPAWHQKPIEGSTTCTDDDLKRFERWLKEPVRPVDWSTFDSEKCLALLARFEAAERVCKSVWRIRPTLIPYELEKDLQDWRTAAGK